MAGGLLQDVQHEAGMAPFEGLPPVGFGRLLGWVKVADTSP